MFVFQIMFYSLVFAYLILELCLSSGGKITDIYCDSNKNEFYLPQGDLCKKCDRCAPGLGLEPLKVKMLITIVHLIE